MKACVSVVLSTVSANVATYVLDSQRQLVSCSPPYEPFQPKLGDVWNMPVKSVQYIHDEETGDVTDQIIILA